MRLRRVLHQPQPAPLAQRLDRRHVERPPVEVDPDHPHRPRRHPRLGVRRIEIQRRRVDVREHRHPARQHHRLGGGEEAEGRHDHLVPRPRAPAPADTAPARRSRSPPPRTPPPPGTPRTPTRTPAPPAPARTPSPASTRCQRSASSPSMRSRARARSRYGTAIGLLWCHASLTRGRAAHVPGRLSLRAPGTMNIRSTSAVECGGIVDGRRWGPSPPVRSSLCGSLEAAPSRRCPRQAGGAIGESQEMKAWMASRSETAGSDQAILMPQEAPLDLIVRYGASRVDRRLPFLNLRPDVHLILDLSPSRVLR